MPMRIYPAIHYTMGGLWVDYNLMSNVPGLHVLGEANFSDHGANRLGASALMQGLADGYFVIPYTIGDYLASSAAAEGHDRPRRVQGGRRQRPAADRPAAVGQGQRAASARSTASSGASCGTTSAWRAPKRACSARSTAIPKLRDEFWQQRLGARLARQPQSEPRVRRPRRRLPRVRRAAGARRACTATNRAAAISAKRARRPKARRCATTSISRTSRPGNSRASAASRCCTRSRWSSTKCIPTQRSYK